MSDGNSIIWMGTGCAAKAMGVGVGIYRKAAKAADTEVFIAERAEVKRLDDIRCAHWFAWLTANAGPGDVSTQIARLGGFAAAKVAYRGKGPDGR